ncbi:MULTISPECIES: hypothetical protein [unclassified Rhizobium]|uniref:hypothetical protein n=1 Tax=unclassified Rhizobium TaxID=2613769 RepID=UPI000714E6F6|nr:MULTISPECIES: hypothetical protein [unclassified Rhizobium]KQT04760.1 hypothetical protein ASG50_15980 [Rhizobium sp. Leaf386]KQT05126.1 hypothetical protein ASG42_21635 [Rhizobium sp. Leaf391]KQU02112.1 hypothetical protein ASG68_28140 [Rhizobium sp. Leaf453]
MNAQHDGLRLFTLLYIDDTEIWNASIGAGKLAFKDVYIRCASNFSQSCTGQGVQLEILTNEPAYVNEQLAKLGRPLIAVGMVFDRDVPRGIPFYAAHFKLDVFRQLGTGNFGNRVGLVDNDVVMLEAPEIDFDLWNEDRLFLYDITPTVLEEYGNDLVKADMERVAGAGVDTIRWYGGEFVAGSSAAFRTLSERIELLWPNYRAAISTLHHVGDEMIVSAAVNLLANEKSMKVTDIGAEPYRWISRWFSARTMFYQMPLSYHFNSSMLHLPADKRFIADFSAVPFDTRLFLSKFRIHVGRKLFARRLLNSIFFFKRRGGKQVSRLN